MSDILYKIAPHPSWIKLAEKDYASYGVLDTEESKVIVAYSIGVLYGTNNTCVLYKYNDREEFMAELEESYKDLKVDLDLQEDYGVFPIYWNKKYKRLFSVFLLVNNPVMNIVDYFFEYDGKTYCFHTYISGEEKDCDMQDLYVKYPNIRHIIDEVDKLY